MAMRAMAGPCANASRIAGLVATVFVPVGLRADVVSIGASKDNTLYESTAGPLSNGAGPGFFTGQTAFTFLLRRGLIAFDVSGAVPAGSTINSATLTLYLSRTLSTSDVIDLHRVTASWGEGTSVASGEGGGGAPATAGDATWQHRSYPTQFWATPGGDFLPQVSASAVVGELGFFSWGPTPGLSADVQAWLDDPAVNFGWLVRFHEPVGGFSKRFESRESPTPAFRPVLTIDFTPPCVSDFNHDQFSDAIDYDLFIGAWLVSDPSSDINHDEFSDAIDYDIFVTAWLAGC